MAEAANNIFKSMDGWWVSGGDQAKVLGQLRGKSAEEIAEIRKSYADHFPGHDLDADIGKNLGKEQLKEAKASLSGKEVDAAVQALRQAKSGTFFGNCDKEQVGKILAGITDPAKRTEVAKQVGPEVLATLDGRDKQLVEAQLAGDKAKENAVKIDDAMHGGLFGGGGFLGMGIGQDKDTVNKALESASTKEEREKLAVAYAEQTKNSTGKSETLTQTLDKNFSGTEKTVATALLDGDKYKASAAKMKLATEGWLFTDKEAIYKELEKTDKNDPELHKKIIEAYNKEYGQGPKGQNLDAMINENFSGLDQDKAQMLKDKGKLDDTFAMKYAMHGSWLSTDKELIKKTLEGKDAEQVKTLVAQYQKDYQIDLRKELQENTSGRAGFEIGQLMKGEAKTPEERLARAEESYQFERGSGSSAFSRGFMDLFSDKGTLLDSQHARVKELADKAQAGKLTKEDEKRLEELTGYQSMDVKTYQESKDAVANTAATAAAVTAGVIVTVASGGTAAPAAVALASAVAGGGASIATKIAIQGAGYSNEDLRNDLVMTGVSAATGGALGAMGAAGGSLSNVAKGVTSSELGQQLIVAGVSGAAGNAINNVTSASLDPNTWKGVNPLGTLAKAGGMGLLTGTASGLASGYVNHAMGQGGAGFSAWKGGVSGGAGAVAGNLVNPEMYHGDSGQLLNKWVSSVAGGTAQGAAAGYQGSLHEEHLKAKAQAAEPRSPEPTPPVSETAEPPTSNTAVKPGESPHPDAKAAAKVIETLSPEHAAGITQALPPEEAAKLAQALPAKKAAAIQEQLPPEAAAKVQAELPAEPTAKIVEHLPPEKAESIAKGTPAESAKKPLTPEHAEAPELGGDGAHPGVDLHNHFLGVVGVDYFVQNAGMGKPDVLLKRIQRDFLQNSALQKEAPAAWRVIREEVLPMRGKVSPDQIHEVLNKLLTASETTPFDSAYTPRDELIQRRLDIQNEMPAVLEMSAVSKDPKAQITSEQQQKLIETFTPKSGTQEDAMAAVMRAKPETLIEKGGLTKEQARNLQELMTNQRYEAFTEGTIRALHGDGIKYSEQSVSLNKLMKRLPPEMVVRVQGRLVQEGIESDLRFLAMVSTDQSLSTDRAGLPSKMKENMARVLDRADVMGVDIAGPEKNKFTPQGAENILELYDLVRSAAERRGRELTLRPHVGEGYPIMQNREPGDFHRDQGAIDPKTNQPIHYGNAEHNVDTLLGALQDLGYGPEMRATDKVGIRFGHATHATPEQIAVMKQLGVMAEANLISNVETGALQPNQSGDILQNHALLSLMMQDVPTMLSTDAQGVMNTKMADQYKTAQALITDFHRGDAPLELEQGKYRSLSALPLEQQQQAQQRIQLARLQQWTEEYYRQIRAGDANDTARPETQPGHH